MNKQVEVSSDTFETLTLASGISVIKRTNIPHSFSELTMTSLNELTVYDIHSLSISPEYPTSHEQLTSIVYRGRNLTALAFHGVDLQGTWVSRVDPKRTVESIVREVEKEIPFTVLLVCNPTKQDLNRNDLIYIVDNEVAPIIRADPLGLGLKLFPKIHGGGYWSIFGKKYPIPFPHKAQTMRRTIRL